MNDSTYEGRTVLKAKSDGMQNWCRCQGAWPSEEKLGNFNVPNKRHKCQPWNWKV